MLAQTRRDVEIVGDALLGGAGACFVLCGRRLSEKYGILRKAYVGTQERLCTVVFGISCVRQSAIKLFGRKGLRYSNTIIAALHNCIAKMGFLLTHCKARLAVGTLKLGPRTQGDPMVHMDLKIMFAPLSACTLKRLPRYCVTRGGGEIRLCPIRCYYC